jgi:hypothetical protein
MQSNEVNSNLTAQLTPFYTEMGCYLQIRTNQSLSGSPSLRFSSNGSQQTMALLTIEENQYSTYLLDPVILANTKNFRLIDNKQTIYEFTDDRQYQLQDQIAEKLVYSVDGLCRVSANPEALFNKTLLWIESDSSDLPTPKASKVNSKIYNLNPKGIPLKRSIEVGVLPNSDAVENIDRTAVYYYNYKRHRWEFSPSKHNPKTGFIETRLDRFATVALLQDNTAPTITSVNVKNMHSYSSDQLSQIQLKLFDNLSGFDPKESSFNMILNGQRLLAAYQPMEKELSYRFTELLESGEYLLFVSINDRAGNSSSMRIKFSIE